MKGKKTLEGKRGRKGNKKGNKKYPTEKERKSS